MPCRSLTLLEAARQWNAKSSSWALGMRLTHDQGRAAGDMFYGEC